MKLFILIAAAMAAVVAAGPKCNPAVHCNKNTVECTVCNPSAESCSNQDTLTQGPGPCIDYQRPTLTADGQRDYSKLIDMSLDEKTMRCIQFMDVNGVKKPSERYDYIASCPEGFLTCFDGFCTKQRSVCNNRCDKNSKCWKRRGSYQQPPVRYFANRCNEDCRNKKTIHETCPSGEDNTVCALQIPVDIPAISASNACCGVRGQPNFEKVDLQLYEGGSCCADIPSDTLIVGGVLPETDRSFNIFPIPLDTYANSQNGYKIWNVTLGDLEWNDVSGSECCCSLHCSCIGDPHCAAFDKEQRSSITPGIEFTMISEGPVRANPNNINGFFLLNITNGERGVANKLTVKFPSNNNVVWELQAQYAHANCWQKVPLSGNGSPTFPPQSNLPKALTENFHGTGNQNCPSTLGDEVTFRARNEIYNQGKNIKYKAVKHHDEDYFRFDVFVERYVQKKEDCCPAPKTLLEVLDTLSKGEVAFGGFCYDPNGEASNQAFEPTASNGRLLDIADNDDTSDMQKFCFEEYCQDSGDPNCYSECLLLAYDFGIDALRSELLQCKTADDSEFRRRLGECESGVTLQATRKGQVNWQFVRAYPAGTKFCGDELVIPFNPGNRLRFRYNGNWQRLTADKFDIRLIERTDIAQSCNPCKNKGTLKKIDASIWTYIPQGELPKVKCNAPETCLQCDNLNRLLV